MIIVTRRNKGRVGKTFNRLDGIKGSYFIEDEERILGTVNVRELKGGGVTALVTYTVPVRSTVSKGKHGVHHSKHQGTSVRQVLGMVKRGAVRDILKAPPSSGRETFTGRGLGSF